MKGSKRPSGIDVATILRIDERIKIIEAKMNELREFEPILRTLSQLLVRTNFIANRLGIECATIGNSSRVTKYKQLGHRRLYVAIGELCGLKSIEEGMRTVFIPGANKLFIRTSEPKVHIPRSNKRNQEQQPKSSHRRLLNRKY